MPLFRQYDALARHALHALQLCRVRNPNGTELWLLPSSAGLVCAQPTLSGVWIYVRSLKYIVQLMGLRCRVQSKAENMLDKTSDPP